MIAVRAIVFAYIGFILALPSVSLAEGVPANCAGILPSGTEVGTPRRDLVVDDLVRLRDIGIVDNSTPQLPIFSLSPDHKSVAFQLRRADAASNAYCLAMIVVKFGKDATSTVIDMGGTVVRGSDTAQGFASQPDNLAIITPKWSPDGSWVAFLRNDGAFDQVWRARADGSYSHALTNVPYNVTAFTWSADGQSVIFAGQPDLEAAQNAIDEEAKTGFLVDARYRPGISNRPWPREPIRTRVSSLLVVSGAVRDATADEQKRLTGDERPTPPAGGMTAWAGPKGALAWTVARDPQHIIAPTALDVRTEAGDFRCDTQACDGVSAVWWRDDRELIFLTRDSWVNGTTGLFEWSPGLGSPRKILSTDDLLLGCQLDDQRLICAHEAATQPRELVAVALRDGGITSLFDPNPEFKSLSLGSVRRYRWTNAYGIKSFGDLVLPPHYVLGEKLPLIVVGYMSKGFLRGGTGDDYPIQLYATHGFAVLSFQRPRDIGIVNGAATPASVVEQDRKDAVDWRSVQSSLEMGINILVSEGIVDRSRVGLTGFSNGASSAQFSIVNSNLFAAVALSHCCEDETSFLTIPGPAYASMLHGFGYPDLTEDGASFWKAMSIRKNADRVNTPLLIQTDDYLLALESVMSLKERNKPVEMYYFPDESHVKWQPAHRQAVYLRSLDWFDFWLRGREDSDPAKRDQYQRWQVMRKDLPKTAGAAPGP